MAEVWGQIISGYKKVSIWGTLPIFLATIVIMLSVITKVQKKETADPMIEFSSKKKYYKTGKIYAKVDYFSEIYTGIFIILGLILFLVIFNLIFEGYIHEALQKIEVLSSIVIGLTSIAIMMAVVIILFDKSYYIVFSIQEVLQKYKFAKWIIIVIGSCLLISINTIALLNNNVGVSYYDIRLLIIEISTIYNIIGISYVLGVIVNIMFLERKNDLHLLDQLHQIFWLHRIDTIQFKEKKNWSKKAIEVNLEYLTDRYVDAYHHKKIKRIKGIEFVTTQGKYKEKWYGKARTKFLLLAIILFIISTLINTIVLQGESLKLLLLNIIAIGLTIGPACFNQKTIQLVILRLFSDTWGYYIDGGNGKERLIPRTVFNKKTIFHRYIMQMNSLNAFFYIWINYIKKKEKYMKDQFKDILKRIEMIDDRNMITYFPVFTIGYFLFEKEIKIAELKKIFHDIVLTENKKYSFERMLHSQIFYLTKNFNEDLFGYRDKLNTYLYWLEVLEE